MDDFYTGRIVWKARKNHMLGAACRLVADIDADLRKQVCAQAQNRGEPVLLFWSDMHLWTLLTNREIISWNGRRTSRIALDDMHKRVTLEPVEGAHLQSTKLYSEYLHVGPARVRIWAPARAPILALMNILFMFPLKGGAEPAPD